MRKISGLLIFFSVILMAILNTATVRRKDSPVVKTQTSTIKLKDKLEELKDGEKGPATPTFGWYGSKNVMSDPPFSKEDAASQRRESEMPLISEVELRQVNPSVDDEGEEEGEAGWDEDWADDDVNEDEDLPQEADNEGVERSVSTAPVDTSKDKRTSKWDKDWWDEI